MAGRQPCRHWRGATTIAAVRSAAAAGGAQPTAKAKPSATARARARAARIRAARAKAARSSRALAEAKTPAFRTDDAGNVVPDVRAAAAIIYDPATGKVLYEENSMDERSIASITKVMTAIVFLETATDLNQEVRSSAPTRCARRRPICGRTTAFGFPTCCTCC